MAAFEGYLFGACNSSGRLVEEFPNKYIEYGSWTSTPDQREELQAYRDDNSRNLIRITAAGRKSVFSFKTRKNLHLADKKAIQKFFTDHESDATQRKIKLRFWNDETNDYDIGDFYRPNMPFPIEKITGNDIIYGELQIELIEY